MRTTITFLIIGTLIILVSSMNSLPWWSFLVPLFLLGILLPLQKWRVHAFLTAFLAGFLTWISATIFYEKMYNGEILASLSGIMEFKPVILYVIIGLIGGVLSGLAFYSGFLLRRGREELKLEISTNKKAE
jgi:ATP/ADP translocase